MPSHYQGDDVEKRALDVYIKLMRAANTVMERSLRDVTDSGLSATQFGVLEALYYLGPLTPSELAAKHLKSRNSLTTVIDNLERDGLVCRAARTCDRRSHHVCITDAGREVVSRLFPLHAKAVAETLGVLTQEEQEMLAVLLRRLGTQERVTSNV